MVVRAVQAGEGERLRDIRLRALLDSPDAFGSTRARELEFPAGVWEERAARSGRGEEDATLVADDDRTWVGMATGHLEANDPSRAGLYGLWVEPGARRSGVGLALTDAVAEWARSRGAEWLLLLVVESNAAAIGLYVALAGLRPLLRYAVGVLPGLGLLALYDRLAFGSPFHLSYRYVSARFAQQQAGGFFGIHAPHWHAIELVLVGNRGLLVDAPVLALAPLGLSALWRRGLRAETALCALVSCAFLVLEFGYYDPYGGASPGPRFLIPALPFLALGLAPAFSAWPRLTTALAAASVLASTAILLTWSLATTGTGAAYPGSVWRGFLGLARSGSAADLAVWTQRTALGWLGIGQLAGAAILAVLGLSALAVAFRDGWSGRTGHG